MKDSAQKEIPFYFDARELGGSLQEVSVEVLRTETQDVKSRWFHSTKDVDLFLWSDERNNIIKQQVSFCGQVVEWNVVEGVKTGYAVEDEKQKPGVGGSAILKLDAEPQATSVNQAIELVRYVGGLSENEREIILENFAKDYKISNMTPNEFLKRYGRRPNGRPRSLMGRILAWIAGNK